MSHILLNCVNGSLYERSDRSLKADRLIIIDNNPLGLDALWCYREAKINRFHSLEMDAKNNDPNEPEQKKIPLTRGAYHLKKISEIPDDRYPASSGFSRPDVRPGKTTTRRVDGR